MKIQVLHKSDIEQNGLWYDIDEITLMEEARRLTIKRAQQIANTYGRTTRIMTDTENPYCYIDPQEDRI